MADDALLDEQVVLEQAAAATPLELAELTLAEAPVCHGRQIARRTINSLILPIAFVGFRPLGQTSTQFMMVWQRNRR